MRKVILDANILVAPVTLGFNLDTELQGLLGEFEGNVTKATMGELDRIDVTADVRRTARAIASKYHLVQTTSLGDDAILEAATTLGAIVVTADRALRKRANQAGLKTIGIREGNRLEWY